MLCVCWEDKLYKMHGTYIKMLNDVRRNSQCYVDRTKHAVRHNEAFHQVTAGGTCNCHRNLKRLRGREGFILLIQPECHPKRLSARQLLRNEPGNNSAERK
jgi:hypothetical protein